MANKLFYVTTGMGACLRVAENKNEAVEKTLRSVGTRSGVHAVREATETDIEWVKSMGGYVPDLAEYN